MHRPIFATLLFTWTGTAAGYRLELGPGDGTYPAVYDVGAATSKEIPDDPRYSVARVIGYRNGVESVPSAPLVFRATAGQLACSQSSGDYQACQTSNFQLWNLITRLRDACGKKCAKVRP